MNKHEGKEPGISVAQERPWKMRREGDISDFFPIARCYFPNRFLSAEGKTECEKEDKKKTKWVWMEGKRKGGETD